MDLGGPVWHASVMPLRLTPQRELQAMTRRVLDGVGDRRRGEWFQRGQALHHRRRLSGAEEALIGPVVDVRCTEEARRRAVSLGPALLRAVPAEVMADELGMTALPSEQGDPDG